MNMIKPLLCLLLVAITTACSDSGSSAADQSVRLTPLKSDELIQFFPTAAWYDDQQKAWHVPIHGWVYEPQTSSKRKALFAKGLKETYDLAPDANTKANFDRRFNLLIADNERDKNVTVVIAGLYRTLQASKSNGHFKQTLVLPAALVTEHRQQGALNYAALTDEENPRVFKGSVSLISAEGLSIISDIDDTIKVSNVTDKKQLFDYTFLRDFEAANGMAKSYQQWSDNGAAVHYVSSSPWQLYVPLHEFMRTAGFPVHTISLKDVRFRDTTLLNLLKKGTETKPAQIEAILQQYPFRQFVLIGDSGEQDPEVYAELISKYPHQIKRIYIRNVTNATRTDQRMTSLFGGLVADKWQLFDDPATLELPQY